MKVVPDVTLDELDPPDSALLVLPGAANWETGGNTEFAAQARQFLAAGVPVAAICGATWGLAVEGLLDDRRHTSNAAEFLAASGYKGGDRYVADQLAVTDGPLVTGSGIAPVELAREVFALLGLYELAVLEAWYKLYGMHDPAGYFELTAA
jgi:putative intracellular protease/amidase